MPDGTNQPAGTGFIKSWQLRNANQCLWPEESRLVYISGDQMSGPAEQEIDEPLDLTGTITVSVSLVAPTLAGDYEGIWQIQDRDGNPASETFSVSIYVLPPPPTPYPSPLLEGIDIIDCNVTFKWSWSSDLAEDEYFALRVWKVGSEDHKSNTWTKEKTHIYPLCDAGDYSWEIAICRGDPETQICEELATSEFREQISDFRFNGGDCCSESGGGKPTPEPL
jgi:hypothetical protein